MNQLGYTIPRIDIPEDQVTTQQGNFWDKFGNTIDDITNIFGQGKSLYDDIRSSGSTGSNSTPDSPQVIVMPPQESSISTPVLIGGTLILAGITYTLINRKKS